MNNRPTKIFICEDDVGIAEVMKTILETEGYQVLLFTDGSGIMDEVEKEKPDLILIDLWMPGMDGKTVAEKLKQNPETANLPVIIVSASSELPEVAEEVQAAAYLAKPFHIKELCETVKQHLGAAV
jgi:two-component system, OmpR family, alkaline phosphatase synthesis response regulator PhoP